MNRIEKAVLLIGMGCAGAGMFVTTGSAGPKKDVNDPVLSEIITSYQPRMPRFVDKYGKDVFVADEPVSRGGLMQAIYEYDKSLKSQKKDYVSRQEFDDFCSRLSLNEKSVPKAAVSLDIMQVINDLQPNMPYILDNSLSQSKVFMSLKKEIEGRTQGGVTPENGGAPDTARLSDIERRISRLEKSETAPKDARRADGDGVSREEFVQMTDRLALIEKRIPLESGHKNDDAEVKGSLGMVKSNIAELSERVARLERSTVTMSRKTAYPLASVSHVNESRNTGVTRQEISDIYDKLAALESQRDGESAAVSSKDLDKRIDGVKRDLTRIEKRVDTVERENAPTGVIAPAEAYGYPSLLTKISFGLSLVAALFIAR